MYAQKAIVHNILILHTVTPHLAYIFPQTGNSLKTGLICSHEQAKGRKQ